MSARELVAQLKRWNGTAAWWQVEVAADYESGLEAVLAVAIVAGWVVVDPQPDPDDDILVITEQAL